MLVFIPVESHFTTIPILYTYSGPESSVLKHNTASHTHHYTTCKNSQEFIFKGMHETENGKHQ